MQCGYNFELGKSLRTTAYVDKAPKDKSASGSSASLGDYMSPPVVSLLYAGAMIGLGIMLSGKPEFSMLIIVSWLLSLVSGLAIIVSAFMDDIVRGILCIFVPFYSLIWLLMMCENPWVKWFGIIAPTVLMVLMFGFGFAETLEGMESPQGSMTP